MYIFGIDIPLVELLFALGIIWTIILIEIAVVLILISYHMKNTKKLEEQVEKLIHALTVLNKEESLEFDKLKGLTKKETTLVGWIRKKVSTAKEISPKERKKLNKSFTKKNHVIKAVDKFLKRWKKWKMIVY